MADNNSEMLALMAELMRVADRDREENMRRFESLTQTMIAAFGRLEDKIDGVRQEMAGISQRVDTLTEEQRITNRRLQAAFDQTDKLTEHAAKTDLRLTRTEQVVPTNAELDACLREVENRLRNAS
jgi:archaellum component FlaC